MDRAMNRIEAALARIEEAAGGLPPPSGGWNLYRTLRDRVSAQLAELDRVIAEMER